MNKERQQKYKVARNIKEGEEVMQVEKYGRRGIEGQEREDTGRRTKKKRREIFEGTDDKIKGRQEEIRVIRTVRYFSYLKLYLKN